MPARPIFIGGTGSHVGKSWVATALCRYLHRMGYRVAPFKAQNMSNNSMACRTGGEIGRAQAVQAEACFLEPHPDMNPILLKPTGSMGSQVVLNGRPWRNLGAAEYYAHFDFLLEHVLAAYSRLAADYDYIVIEGAGSITELNLKHRDLVNLGLAVRLGAPSLLVADIDRGGIFASVAGTFQLLDETESPLVRSFMVNRFRGDMSLFKGEGVRMLEDKAGRPCMGVFPFASDIEIDPEDSVSLDNALQHRLGDRAPQMNSRIAIIRFPHISNFTDFRLLPNALYVSRPSAESFDTIFLPGTKSTIEDMIWLRETGLEQWLLDQVRDGCCVVGICGGFQMMGETISDPFGVESGKTSVRGIGLIPAGTQLSKDKITRPVAACTPSGIPFKAYEIHMGSTIVRHNDRPFAFLDDGTTDGVRIPKIVGTYLHGAFEDRAVLEDLLGRPLGDFPPDSKDAHYDRLAGWFSEHADLGMLHREYLNISISQFMGVRS